METGPTSFTLSWFTCRPLNQVTIKAARSVKTRYIHCNLFTLICIPLFYIALSVRLLKYVTNCFIRPNSSIAAFVRTARGKLLVNLKWLVMKPTAPWKFRRWRCYRPTWPDLEGPSRLDRPDSQVAGVACRCGLIIRFHTVAFYMINRLILFFSLLLACRTTAKWPPIQLKYAFLAKLIIWKFHWNQQILL